MQHAKVYALNGLEFLILLPHPPNAEITGMCHHSWLRVSWFCS